MQIDIEVELGQAESKGRNILGYMFEGPQDLSENVRDNSVWLNLEIFAFFHSSIQMHVHINCNL